MLMIDDSLGSALRSYVRTCTVTRNQRWQTGNVKCVIKNPPLCVKGTIFNFEIWTATSRQIERWIAIYIDSNTLEIRQRFYVSMEICDFG